MPAPRRQMVDDLLNRELTVGQVRNKFEHIDSLIQDFVQQYLPKTVCQSWHRTFEFITPSAEEFLADEELCPLLLMAWIWNFLYDKIFQRESSFWGGSVGQTFARMCVSLEAQIPANKIAEYFECKVAEVKRLRLSEADRRPQINAAREEIFTFFYCQSSGGLGLQVPESRTTRNLGPEFAISKIIEKAVKLDIAIRQSRAHWSITFPDLYAAFDETSMNDASPYDEPEDAEVIMVVTPILAMAGTVEGHAYDRTTILVPSDVVLC